MAKSLSVAVKYKAAPYGILKNSFGIMPLYAEINPVEATASLNSDYYQKQYLTDIELMHTFYFLSYQ
jgi:hypothetical protein